MFRVFQLVIKVPLKVFGGVCSAISHGPKRDKLGPKAVKHVFLGNPS